VATIIMLHQLKATPLPQRKNAVYCETRVGQYEKQVFFQPCVCVNYAMLQSICFQMIPNHVYSQPIKNFIP
jgi:hypothetical protein